MNVKDSISATMDSIEGKESEDKSAKNIFSYKPIMGNILKYTVAEYKDCSLEEIMDCIEGDTIQTGTALVEEDMAQTIRGERTETNATGEPPAEAGGLDRHQPAGQLDGGVAAAALHIVGACARRLGNAGEIGKQLCVFFKKHSHSPLTACSARRPRSA